MRISIGKIVKPQGINGEVKLVDFSDGISSLEDLEAVYIDGKEYRILSLSARDGALFMCLRGVFDRNAAELLRGKEVFCDKEKIIKSDDSFFIEDIIGCELYLSSGKLIGRITDVTPASVDVFAVDSVEGEAYFPFLKDLNAVVDVDNKRVTVDAKRFTEVVLYRDKK